jgi:hypothetical protein
MRLLIALSCLASLWLSGCSTTSSSTADPPAPTPAVSSGTVEPSATPVPETPEEFVRRWVAADTRMQNTGDGGEYRRMSATCPNCQRYADYIEGIWKSGGYVKTGGWSIRSARTSKELSKGHYDVTIGIRSDAVEYSEEEGAPVKHYDASESTYVISVSPHRRQWLVTDFAQVAE